MNVAAARRDANNCELHMQEPQVVIGGLNEQDTDLLLLAAISRSAGLASWIIGQLPRWPRGFTRLTRAERSVESSNGETDLQLTYANAAGITAQVLLENKISAAFQPRQRERYRARARGKVARREQRAVAIALIAPRKYALRTPKTFDAFITYEALSEQLSAQPRSALTKFVALGLESAIEKATLGYNPDSDKWVTSFWRNYWAEAKSLFPDLTEGGKEPSNKPAGAGFIWFWPPAIAPLNICHKLMKGYVDLHFPDWGGETDSVTKRLRRSLEGGMNVVRANKSAAVRLRVPKLETGEPFNNQRDAVQQGLDAAQRLYSWALRERLASSFYEA